MASLDPEYNCAMPESEITFNVYESPEGGYIAKKADDAIIVYADTMDVPTVKIIKDAVRCEAGESRALPSDSSGECVIERTMDRFGER